MAFSRFQCPYCSDDFGQELRFSQHLSNQHQIIDQESLYVDRNLQGIKPMCACGCKKPLLWNGWRKGYASKYLRGHNASVDTCFAKPEIAKQLAENRRGNPSWNKGLTKKTDVRVAKMSETIASTLRQGYESGRIIDWRVKDPQKAQIAAKMSSETKKQQFLNGTLVIWNNGLTKETNASLMRVSEANKTMYDDREAGRRIKVNDLLKRINDIGGFDLISDPNEYITRRVNKLIFRCTTCQSLQTKSLAMLEESPKCFVCHPKESVGQLELFEFVKSIIKEDVVLSDREILDGKELDVWIPSLNIGIEFNGVWYHTEAMNKGPRYHRDKLQLARARGIKLLTFYDDEWSEKRHIVESMILSKIGKLTQSIGARKCDVIDLSITQRRSFFANAHVAGDVSVRKSLGLIYEGEIVAALSLRSPFHGKYKKRFLEIARFASKPGLTVSGALGKLVHRALNYANEQGFVGLMSYVDLNHGDGHSYERVGFKLESETNDRFWWVENGRRVDRFKYKADKRRNMSEADVAKEAGVTKVWGCGNRLYVMLSGV